MVGDSYGSNDIQLGATADCTGHAIGCCKEHECSRMLGWRNVVAAVDEHFSWVGSSMGNEVDRNTVSRFVCL